MANTDAALLRIYLRRQDSSHPWGFRLQGGADFQTPITIQLVQPNSIADRSGLQAGDNVLMINDQAISHMTHEQAKMEIIRSANDFTFQMIWVIHYRIIKKLILNPSQNILIIVIFGNIAIPFAIHVQRGGPVVWQPKQTVLQQPVKMSVPGYQQEPLPQVTKTSLKANTRESQPIGVSHNLSASPFAVPEKVMTSNDGRVRRVAHSQFNSPLGLYSDQNVSSTYDQKVQEASRGFGSSQQGSPGTSQEFRSVQAPTRPRQDTSGKPSGVPASMFCGACGEMIKGVFVRVQGRIPMHPECLKCTKCAVGLRTQGYFYINDKLYCETHAKQVARPPEPGMKPMTVYK